MALLILCLHDCSITCDNVSLIFAYQDGVVATRRMQSHIFGFNVSDSCRICGHCVESVERVLSSWIPPALTIILLYSKWHNKVSKILWSITTPTLKFICMTRPPSMKLNCLSYIGISLFQVVVL